MLLQEEGMMAPFITFERSRMAALAEFILEGSVDLLEWEEIPVELIETSDAGDRMERLYLRPKESGSELPETIFYRVRFSPEALF